jgi:hypothetical protein
MQGHYPTVLGILHQIPGRQSDLIEVESWWAAKFATTVQ